MFVSVLLFWQGVYRVSDNAMVALFKLLKILLLTLSKLMNTLKPVAVFASRIPISLAGCRKVAGIDRDSFITYVVCEKCHSVYDFDSCYDLDEKGNRVAKKCQYIKYPQCNMKPCNEVLLINSVYTRSKIPHLVPKKVFCYQSLINSIERLLVYKDILNILNHWKNRDEYNGFLCDIYDGRIWKEFVSECIDDGRLNLGVMLNVDWFNPFKKAMYSAGGMYLTVLNLPRQLRFKEEYSILLGIIPGPKEPSLTINSYLAPFVQELDMLSTGVWVKCDHVPKGRILVCCRLLGVTSDIPAIRKVCGHLGIHAAYGCHKCIKKFTKVGKRTNFSGFDVDNWKIRENREHRSNAQAHFNAQNKDEMEKIESSTGVRYSTLMELEYFDMIRGSCIDPMHNLFLGTCKHLMEFWIKHDIIDHKKLCQIQTKVNDLQVPRKIGRLPNKVSIGSGFVGMKAAEWKNWVLIYSVYCLRGLLPDSDLEIWKKFVRSCYILCQQSISITQAKEAHELLIDFNQSLEQKYGWEISTMNMHLHCHLLQSLLDFGPIYSFWCFPYERYNGILGSYSTNHQSIVVQLMRKFTASNFYSVDTLSYQINPDLVDDMKAALLVFPPANVRLTMSKADNPIVTRSTLWGDPSQCKLFDSDFEMHKPIHECFFDDKELESITFMYNSLYDDDWTISIPRLYYKASDVSNESYHLTSSLSLSQGSSYVYANWFSGVGDNGLTLSVGNVMGFMKHVISVRKQQQPLEKHSYVVAKITWQDRLLSNQPYDPYFHLWATSSADCINSFIPVARIMCTAAVTKSSHTWDNLVEPVIVSIPLHRII